MTALGCSSQQTQAVTLQLIPLAPPLNWVRATLDRPFRSQTRLIGHEHQTEGTCRVKTNTLLGRQTSHSNALPACRRQVYDRTGSLQDCEDLVQVRHCSC